MCIELWLTAKPNTPGQALSYLYNGGLSLEGIQSRIQQATFVAKLAQDILSANGGDDLIVLGDLNDFLDS